MNYYVLKPRQSLTYIEMAHCLCAVVVRWNMLIGYYWPVSGFRRPHITRSRNIHNALLWWHNQFEIRKMLSHSPKSDCSSRIWTLANIAASHAFKPSQSNEEYELSSQGIKYKTSILWCYHFTISLYGTSPLHVGPPQPQFGALRAHSFAIQINLFLCGHSCWFAIFFFAVGS